MDIPKLHAQSGKKEASVKSLAEGVLNGNLSEMWPRKVRREGRVKSFHEVSSLHLRAPNAAPNFKLRVTPSLYKPYLLLPEVQIIS